MADNTIKTQDNNNIFTGANGTGTDGNSIGLKIARAADVANLPYGAFSSANVAMVMNTVKALANNIYANFIPNKRILTGTSPIFYKNGDAQHPASGTAADDEQKSKFNYLVTGLVLKDNLDYHKPIINGSRDYNKNSSFIIPEMPANVNDVKNKIFGYGASAVGLFTAEVNTGDNFGIDNENNKIGIPINHTAKKVTAADANGTDATEDFNISFIEDISFSDGVLTKTKGQLTFNKKGILKSYQTGIVDNNSLTILGKLSKTGTINSVKNDAGVLKYNTYGFDIYGKINSIGTTDTDLLEPLTAVELVGEEGHKKDPTAADLNFIYNESGILKEKNIKIERGKVVSVTNTSADGNSDIAFAPTFITDVNDANKNASAKDIVVNGSPFTKSTLTTNNQGFSKIETPQSNSVSGGTSGSFNAIVYTAANGENPAKLEYKAISIAADGRVTSIPSSGTNIPILFENAQSGSFNNVRVSSNILYLDTVEYTNGQITGKTTVNTPVANVLSTANGVTNLTVAGTTIDTTGKITTSEAIEANGGIVLPANNNNTGTITIS